MKKTIALFLSLVLAVSAAGCGKGVAKSESSTTADQTESTAATTKEATTKETTVETTEATTAATTAKETTPAGGLSDDLYDFTVALNGITYSIPCPYTDIEANGWKADFGTETIDPGYYDIVNAKNGGITLCFDIANLGVDSIPYAEGYIGGFSYGVLENSEGCTIELSKGITYGSTKEEVLAAYGEPTRTYEGDSYLSLSYENDSYSSYKFMIDSETGLVESIDIQNLVVPETTDNTAAVSGDVPAIISAYKAPTDLGKDLLSFNVKYGGNLYNLPAPVAEFVKNGWKVKDGAGKTVVAKGYLVGVTLSKDNQTLSTTVENYTDNATTVENCFVTEVEYNGTTTKIPLELPGGITDKSTYDEMIAAYGKPDNSEESSKTYHYYTYGDIWEKVEFCFNTEESSVLVITVQHNPKEFGK